MKSKQSPSLTRTTFSQRSSVATLATFAASEFVARCRKLPRDSGYEGVFLAVTNQVGKQVRCGFNLSTSSDKLVPNIDVDIDIEISISISIDTGEFVC